jgi:hypothetical protein
MQSNVEQRAVNLGASVRTGASAPGAPKAKMAGIVSGVLAWYWIRPLMVFPAASVSQISMSWVAGSVIDWTGDLVAVWSTRQGKRE